MTQEERAKYIAGFLEGHCFKLLATKGVEYTLSGLDVNNNFKRLGNELNLDPNKVLWIFLKKHLDAILNFINNGKVESEPIEGRIADAVNYLLILASILEEQRYAKSLNNKMENLAGQLGSAPGMLTESWDGDAKMALNKVRKPY